MDSKLIKCCTLIWIFTLFVELGSANTYERFENTSCDGNDILSAPKTPTECESSCNSVANCVAYVVSSDASLMQCTLKHTCAILTDSAGNITHRRACLNGTYGYTKGCTGQCSGNCRDGEVCNQLNGDCDSGCVLGYDYNTDPKCGQECANNTYGYNCDICPSSCNNSCEKLSAEAVCIGGCTPGYQGDDCLTECADGRYGYNCDICPSTCNNGCDKFSAEAVCIDGCTPGYQGDNCSTECEENRYGYNCTDMCPARCVNGCDKFTTDVVCTGGCRQGYKGTDCSIACPDNTYGENCAGSCGHCLNGQSCDPITGQCPNALCHPGYHTLLCDKQCDSGRFGLDCAQVCDCSASSCHHINGCPDSPTSDDVQLIAFISVAVAVFSILINIVIIIVCCVCMSRSKGSDNQKNQSKPDIIDQPLVEYGVISKPNGKSGKKKPKPDDKVIYSLETAPPPVPPAPTKENAKPAHLSVCYEELKDVRGTATPAKDNVKPTNVSTFQEDVKNAGTAAAPDTNNIKPAAEGTPYEDVKDGDSAAAPAYANANGNPGRVSLAHYEDVKNVKDVKMDPLAESNGL